MYKKALIASGVKMQNYGTVMVTLADEDKEEALPLIRRFYEMGFNIEATVNRRVSESAWDSHSYPQKA